MRLFVGIDLPKEIKQVLLGFQSELRELGVSGSWKLQDNFHITLEFLGELESHTISLLTNALSNKAINSKPFKLNIGGLGGFPSMKRPHTLWTAVGGRLNELHQLRDEIHMELANNGFALEERPFKPHITLVSRPSLDGIDLSVLQTKKLGEFRVEEVVLFESKVIRGKRIYPHLYQAGLGT